MKYLLPSILILLLSPAFGQENHNYRIGTQHQLYSEILEEERSYWLSLPASYESDPFYTNKHYPILVLLDGHRLFHITTGIVQQMSLGSVEEIPEMIVVAIENTNRNRDLCPNYTAKATSNGAVFFRQFLEEELLPEIDTRYRTTPFRILLGHSYGGLFAIDTYLEQGGFAAYLAIDPSLWWQEQGIHAKARAGLNANAESQGRLYVAQANMPFNPGLEGGRMGIAIQEFKSIVVKPWDCQFEFFSKEDHFSIPMISIFEGLRWLFRDYRYDLQAVKYANIDSFRQHQDHLIGAFGLDLSPPGKIYNEVGNYLYFQAGEQSAGKALLRFNAEHFSSSIPALLSLAAVYEAEGQITAAIIQLEHVLALEPDNSEIQDRLKRLNDNH